MATKGETSLTMRDRTLCTQTVRVIYVIFAEACFIAGAGAENVETVGWRGR